jgi:integrase
MTKANAENERAKRAYFAFLREAQGRDEATVDRVAASLTRFERVTGARDFKKFHREQAVAFKAKLYAAENARTGERLSKSTVASILRDLREFFHWLSREPGYRSHLAWSDADYFNLPDKDLAVARARREPNPPTVEQAKRVLDAMPAGTALERRDRAVVAFAAVTGARVAAIASIRLDHVDLTGGFVDQDARVVCTKGAKSFRSDFHQVVPGAVEIVTDWCVELAGEHGFGPQDPLFPQTEVGLDAAGGFAPVGLARKPWSTTEPIRAIFRRAFAAAGLPYRNPHSLRAMLVRHYMRMDLTPAQAKAVSQSLGHSDVLTTFTSYGQVPAEQQSDLIRGIAARSAKSDQSNLLAKLKAVLDEAQADAPSS